MPHTVGIVCEYNPFHRGHLYMLEECRRSFGADTMLVCALSGDYVQRGEAAIFDKFTRAEAACRCGADLVLELPLPWCVSPAEGFAAGAVSLLAAAGCDTLAFGSESGDLTALDRLSDFLLEPSTGAEIRRLMEEDRSLSYARARQRAAQERLGEDARLLSSANDILAVEYLKAVKRNAYPMTALPIRRRGSGHDSQDAGEFPSAMLLRAAIGRGEDVSALIPQEARPVFEQTKARIRTDRLETALLSRLLTLPAERFDTLPDAGGGAGRHLYKALRAGGSLEEVAARATTKGYTESRMRRMLLCAALGIRAEDGRGVPPYLRALAFNERGRAFLGGGREKRALPTLIKPAAVRTLGPRCLKIFTIGAEAHDLYRLASSEPSAFKADEDWKRGPAIV